MSPGNVLFNLITETTGDKLADHCIFSWHQLSMSGNFVLFHTIGLGMNSRSLVWLNCKSRMFLGATGNGSDHCTEMWGNGT